VLDAIKAGDWETVKDTIDPKKVVFFTSARNAIDAYAAKHQDDNTAQLIKQYFEEGGTNDNSVVQLSKPLGKQQAVQRLDDLIHLAGAYKDSELDIPLINEKDISSVLQHLIDKPPFVKSQPNHPPAVAHEPEQDLAEQLMDRRHMTGMLFRAAFGAVVANKVRVDVEQTRTGSAKRQFVDACMQLVEEGQHNKQQLKQQFGKLYDKARAMQSRPAQVAGQLAANAVEDLVMQARSPEFTEQLIENLAATLRPRVDAIVDWNRGLVSSGFVSLEKETYSPKEISNARAAAGGGPAK
jgi:hypothetical protein